VIAVAILIVLGAFQIVYACVAELRSDEAYYWTWSKENVLSFLDHPPMIAWFVRFGTAIFGDTNLGARFSSLLAIWIAQGLIGDIVWRQTRDARAVLFAVLMPQVTLEYGLFGSRILPDAALIPFSLAMIWALVRLSESGDGRWWLAAGFFGGLALLSKYTAVLLAPAILVFAFVPPWRVRWLGSLYPWLALAIALLMFSPVLYWNWSNEWASFRFQSVRIEADHGVSLRTVGDYLGLQAGLVGPILFPVVLAGSIMLGWRGYRRMNPVHLLLSACVLVPFTFFLWRSLSLRVGDTWPLLIWPFAFAAAAINLVELRQQPGDGWIKRTAPQWALAAIAVGAVINIAVFSYYVLSTASGLGMRDPVGSERGYHEVAQQAKAIAEKSGAGWIATVDYRVYAMLRWHLKDSIPVVQVNERSRFIGFKDRGIAEALTRPGLYVVTAPSAGQLIETATPATLTTVGIVERVWRGVVIDRFDFKTVTNWKPDLSPPRDSPFYRWRSLG
jgi:4-amino-4-deoxy-L-arabinose transferase-like glycosyltransferase